MAEIITIPDLENGKVDIDTLADIVNLQEPTTDTRLSGPVNTWFGVQSSLSAATGRAFTTKAAMDAAPGSVSGQAARVTEDGGNNGLYLWSGSAWVKTKDPVIEASEGANPVFVQAGPRAGITSATPSAFMAFVRDIQVYGANPGKEYKMGYFQNQALIGGVADDSFIIYEYTEGTWDAQRTIVGTNTKVVIDRSKESQTITVYADDSLNPHISFGILLNPKNLPAPGTQIAANTTGVPGYSHKISRSAYNYAGSLNNYTINGGKVFPLKRMTRGGVNIAPNVAFNNLIIDVKVRGARPDKYYSINYLTNGDNALSPASEFCWVIDEFDVANFETAPTSLRLISWTTAQPNIVRDGSIQKVTIDAVAVPGIEIDIVVDSSKLPPAGTSIRATAASNPGYSCIIDPVNYVMAEPVPTPITGYNAPVNVEYEGSDKFALTFDRGDGHNIELVVMPNGFNDLFNIKSVTSTNRETGATKVISDVATDWFPPLAMLATTAPLDDMTGRNSTGYTGGNHDSVGDGSGIVTAEMFEIEHYVDGVKVDKSTPFNRGANEYRAQWKNRLFAWNTCYTGRYAIEQHMSMVVRKGCLELWHKVVFLEPCDMGTDNGIQTITTNFDTFYYYNGVDRVTSYPVATASAQTSGAITAGGGECFAVRLKGDALSGTQLTWIDKEYGAGDMRYVNTGTIPVFTRGSGGNTKVYARMVNPGNPVPFTTGGSYDWHMGIAWAGLESDLDSAFRLFKNNKQHLMYADSAAGVNHLDVPVVYPGEVVDGEVVGASGVDITIAAPGASEQPL